MTINVSQINLLGIAGWKFVPDEPRHNTFHNSLALHANVEGIPIRYLGLRHTFKADWIIQVMPETVLKRIPYMSPINYLRIRKVLNFKQDSKTVIYMFEGTLTWLILLKLLSRFISNSVVVCNLFSSSRHSRILFSRNKIRLFYKLILQLMLRSKNIYITFDTQLMVEKVNLALGGNLVKSIFPLPSALPYLQTKKKHAVEHHKILVNMRDFEISKLHILLNHACRDCTFVFPRGPLASAPLWTEFDKYPNLYFDKENIPVENYLEYIDQFDYMVFLYKPSIDSSGKILDAIVRRIPLCVPMQSSEWCDIAREYGQLHEFDWDGAAENIEILNHPIFLQQLNAEEPPFTPLGSLRDLSYFAENLEVKSERIRGYSELLATTLVTVYWLFALMGNAWLSIFSRFRLVISSIK